MVLLSGAGRSDLLTNRSYRVDVPWMRKSGLGEHFAVYSNC